MVKSRKRARQAGPQKRSRRVNLASQPGVLIVAPAALTFASGKASLVIGIPADRMKAELEQASPPSENNYGLFRSARQSMSQVEEFMRL